MAERIINGQIYDEDSGDMIGRVMPSGRKQYYPMSAIISAKGDKGDTGARGAKGDTGDAGAKGDTGNQGDIGPKGDTGLQGLRGFKGDTGDVGVKGDVGTQGVKGDTGPTSKVPLGTVTLTQTAVVAIGAGTRNVTLTGVAGVLANDDILLFPTAALPAGYSLGGVAAPAAGTLIVSVNAPLLAIGASYSITCRVVALR